MEFAVPVRPVELLHSVRSTSRYWGNWFVPLGDGDVKQTNLNIFYHLGASLATLYDHISVGMPLSEFYLDLVFPYEWMKSFLAETDSFVPTLNDTRRSAERLEATMRQMLEEIPRNWEGKLTESHFRALVDEKAELEKSFEREHRNLDVFTVTHKGIYDTRLLIEHAELKFPHTVLRVLPSEMFYELEQAGRCPAFDVPTACAFHMFRATEVLILHYYEVLTGRAWTINQRNWGRYITELNKLPKANPDVTMRLEEIRKFERNPSIHPEIQVSLDKAPVLFELCSGVIYTMAEEIRKLTP